MFHGIKDWIGVYGLKEGCAGFGIAGLRVHGVKAAKLVDLLLRENIVPAWDWKRQRLSMLFFERLLKSGGRFDGRKAVERACLHRDGESEPGLCSTA